MPEINPVQHTNPPKMRGRPFGEGNRPAGRPKGSLSRFSLAAQVLLEGESEMLTRTCVEMARERDPVALKLCMERILPPRKEWPVQFEMPPLQSGTDVREAMGAVINAVAEGKLLLSQAVDFAKLLEIYNRTVNFAGLTDIEKMTDDEIRAAILRMQALGATDAELIEPADGANGKSEKI